LLTICRKELTFFFTVQINLEIMPEERAYFQCSFLLKSIMCSSSGYGIFRYPGLKMEIVSSPKRLQTLTIKHSITSQGAAICLFTRLSLNNASLIIYTYFKIWNQNMEVFNFKQSCTTNVEFGRSFYPDDLNCKLLWNIS
jgi:hypothetical protein